MMLSICFLLKPKETKYVDLFLGGPRHKPRGVSRGSPWLLRYLYNHLLKSYCKYVKMYV